MDKEKWLRGQVLEGKIHEEESKPYSFVKYMDTYVQYFKHLDIDNLSSKTVLEIGSAFYPALCYYTGQGMVIEPIPSKELENRCNSFGITLIVAPAEEVEFPQVDEVWMFNVLQHTIDPDLIIEKAKKAASTIRFFEPINTPIDEMHHHSFDLNYYKKHFGQDVVKHYPKQDAVHFHTWECAYGVWTKEHELANDYFNKD